jgi:hypothetical protein
MRSTPESTDEPLVLPPKPPPAPASGPTWRSTDTKGIERSDDGRLRTNSPPPSPVWAPAVPVVHVDEQCED